MIDLYTWGTPNGKKISIALEEMGLPYTVHPVDIGNNEQFAPEFLAISPNNKIPAIVDRDSDESIFESGAILIYLSLKSNMFYPAANRMRILEWLMWQMSGFGPMLGRAHYFLKYNPGKAPFAEEWFKAEAARLYGVLDKQLAQGDFMCADYSIADMATFPWAARHQWQGVDLRTYPNVLRWYREIAARPAVLRGYGVPSPDTIPMPD